MPGQGDPALSARFLTELWNNQNLSIIDTVTTENYILHLPQGDLQGRQDLKDVATFYFKSFTRIQVSIEGQTSQDDRVVTYIIWDTQLNLGDQSASQEIPRQITVRGVAIDRFENGLIAESWDTLDMLYWLYNTQVLSRQPEFVWYLPSLKACPCPKGFVCVNKHCVLPHKLTG